MFVFAIAIPPAIMPLLDEPVCAVELVSVALAGVDPVPVLKLVV
jgi:hypothetical protein